MPETIDPVDLSDDSRLRAAVEIVGELLWYGTIVIVPTVALAIPTHWVLVDAFVPPIMDSLKLGADARPLLSGFFFIFACFATLMAVKRYYSAG
jgi:hypothetical protein